MQMISGQPKILYWARPGQWESVQPRLPSEKIMPSKRSRKYRAALEQIDQKREYSLVQAIEMIKKMKYTKFEGSLEGHFKINYKSIQNIKGGLKLPHGTGKKVNVLVFAKGEKAGEAKKAGADHVGDNDLIKKIQDGWFDFDFAVSTPDMMKDVGKLGPVLGKRGLMPKPKAGTVTMEMEKTIKRLKSGWVELKCDKSSVIHLGIGKLSFDTNKLIENSEAVYQSIMREKPSDARGEYLTSFYLNGTMTPSVKIDTKDLKN